LRAYCPGPRLYFTSTSPRATTSRNTFFREQLTHVMKSVLGPVHATDMSYLPFATNTSPSSPRNLSDELCTFTIELKSVVAPQLRSKTFATSRPSAEAAFDVGVSLQGLQDRSHATEQTKIRNTLFLLVAAFLIVLIPRSDLGWSCGSSPCGRPLIPVTPFRRRRASLPSTLQHILGHLRE